MGAGLRIVLLGGPGVGKGTQAKRISASFGIPHVSTGDILRASLSTNTEEAREVKKYLKEGHLVPDILTCSLVVDRLAQPDCVNGFILDGFPRSLPQAKMLDELLDQRGDQLDVALKFQVSDDEVVARLTARRMCTQCGSIYNLIYDPPPDPERCPLPDCRGALTQREDDKEETIRERLRVYHETKDPIIRYYEERGLLRIVDAGKKTPEEVNERIEDILASLQGAAS